MPDIVIGFDLGTTILKAAAFDRRTGRAAAQASRRLQVRTGANGSRELDPLVIDRAVKEVVGAIRRQLAWKRFSISGIGLAAQGGSTVIADRRTGRPLTSMMLWNDSRHREYLLRIAAKKPASYWRTLSRRSGPGAGLARMLWLKEKRPKLFCKENIYAGAGEYLYFRLTGAWRQDAGNALQIGCYRVSKCDLDAEPLDIVGVPLSFVSPMREGHSTHPLSQEGAKLVGAAPGVPVAGPYMDHEAGFLSAAGVTKRPLQCSLGTAWVGNFIVQQSARFYSPMQLVLPAPVGKGRLVVQPLLTGNVTWDWALETLVDEKHKKALSKADAVFKEELLAPEGLVAIPWLTQAHPVKPEASGGGMFIGMNPRTDKAELLRAVAAGMCYEMARVFSEVRSSGVVDAVILGGGASKGRHFRELLSALFAPLPVFAVEDEGLAGPRGAIFPFSRKAASAKMKKVPLPAEKQQRRITEGYQIHLAAIEKLCGGIELGGIFTFGKGKKR